MAELNDSLWGLLGTIQWSYAALWTLTPNGRDLEFEDGWFNVMQPADVEAEDCELMKEPAVRFYQLYSPLILSLGVGYAGHALANLRNILWLCGEEELASIPNPVHDQTMFIKTAGIQTIVCIPLENRVWELGTVNMIMETDELAHCIKKLLYTSLRRYLTKGPTQFNQNIEPFTLEMDLPSTSRLEVATSVDAVANQFPMPTLEKQSNLLTLPTVYDVLEQDYMAPSVIPAPGMLQNQLVWPQQPMSMPMVQIPTGANALQSWTSMQEAAQPSGSLQSGMSGAAETSSVMVENMDTDRILPLNLTNPFLSAETSLLASSQAMVDRTELHHRSSTKLSRRCSLPDDNDVSSAEIREIASNYADCHLSDPAPQRLGAGSGESEGSWIHSNNRLRRSLSRETSPDSSNQVMGATARVPEQQSFRFHAGSSSTALPAVHHRARPRLERQNSDSVTRADTTPVLVQCGNILQLGNISGEVTEEPPMEHDEAARSHMLAERRRRNKQNENFSHLKSLIPAAAKMDKASVLAATIVYINNLKAQVDHWEHCYQSMKLIVGDQVPEPLFPQQLPVASPARSSRSVSPSEADKIQVSPDGEGNLKIEIRNPNQSDTALQLLACLKELQLKIMSSDLSINENRIHASFLVKMKRKNSAGQSAVCEDVERALRFALRSGHN